MGLGKRKNKDDCPFGIEGKNEIYAITPSLIEQNRHRTKLGNSSHKLDLSYHKRLQTTNFSRIFIVNPMASELIYPCIILNIPVNYRKEISKEITTFIFAGILKNSRKKNITCTKETKRRYRTSPHTIKNYRVGYITEIIIKTKIKTSIP